MKSFTIQLGSGRGAGKIVTPRRAATRAKLVSATRELIAERGVAATSVEEISERAGFTRGAFYSNFDDIYDILTIVSAQEFAKLQEGLKEAWERVLAENPNNALSLSEIAEKLLAAIPLGKDFYLIQSELALLMVRKPELRQKLAVPRELFHQELGSFLELSLRALGLKLRGDRRAITETIVALLRHASEAALTSGRTENLIDPSEHARIIIPVLMEAVTEEARGHESK
ncbi:TetR/AcrR family transcriptional regulator [Boudabousia marimammalium]|uniref:HTH tetR-type domain-containing protein n=1 Tax=Boudabousia marimammalium TaxID=156892 RepID=A0A1Q5PRW0_9ACTO|nr:TetR/AcrR family transcriptional regulator [Boudabousia marimammalium]OKL50317.1 hypothetical protein BM477_02735 [Boudabousia marimammalium]